MTHAQLRNPTIDDVARVAGVSRTTVSRVLNGTVTVDPALSARVKDAAEALGYTPSQIARGLARGRTHSVGILVPELTNPIFQRTLTGLSQAAGANNYQVLIADSSERQHSEAELIVELRRRCDAVVLCSPRLDDEKLSAVVSGISPVVMIYRSVPTEAVPVVGVDLERGMTMLAQHLVDLGHTRLAYLDGGSTSRSGGRRFVALESFALSHPNVDIARVTGGGTIAAGFEAKERVLASGATGVMAFNDIVAMGLMSALHQDGMRVPEDLSLTGFDGITYSEYTDPPLTTAAIAAEELGRLAWERLHSMLTGAVVAGDVQLEPVLHVRASTARI